MSTRATLEANTSTDKTKARKNSEAFERAMACFEEGAEILAKELGSNEVAVRNTIWAEGERAGYRRCCTEMMAHVEQLGKSLPEQGRQVLRPVYEWLQRQREVRL